MSDIADALEQDAVADTLLGDTPAETSDQQESTDADRDAAGPVDRGEFEEGAPEELGELAEFVQEQEAPEQEQEWQQEPTYEPTAQEIQAGIQQLDQVVEDLGLNDPAETAIFASALGADPANSAALGSVMAKTTLSALQIWEQSGGDLSNVGAIPREAAMAFTGDFLRALGVDPRMAEVNPEQLAGVVLGGALNFIQAVDTYGLNASLDVLNSAEGAQWFADYLLQCFGGNQPADRQGALALADAGGRYMLSVLRKLDAQRAEQPRPSRQSQGRRSPGRSSSRVFQSNSDLFDEGAELWRYAHGRM